nr:helix-turn-helix domain-containing protein [Lachnospiraceae bacterium]
MNQYVTGAVIKELREKNKMTQLQLAEKLGVSDKTVSKWETAKGYQKKTHLEPNHQKLQNSVKELLYLGTFHNLKICTNKM